MDLFETLFGKSKKDYFKEAEKKLPPLNDQFSYVCNSYTVETKPLVKDTSDGVVCKFSVEGFDKSEVKVTAELVKGGVEISVVAEKVIDQSSTKMVYKTVVNRGIPEQFHASFSQGWVTVEWKPDAATKKKVDVQLS